MAVTHLTLRSTHTHHRSTIMQEEPSMWQGIWKYLAKSRRMGPKIGCVAHKKVVWASNQQRWWCSKYQDGGNYQCSWVDRNSAMFWSSTFLVPNYDSSNQSMPFDLEDSDLSLPTNVISSRQESSARTRESKFWVLWGEIHHKWKRPRWCSVSNL